MPDSLYWQLTPPELKALVEAIQEREEAREVAASQRAAAILAEIRNTTRSKSTQKVWTADDFYRPPRKTDPWAEPSAEAPLSTPKLLSPEQTAKAMSQWAQSHNKRHRA